MMKFLKSSLAGTFALLCGTMPLQADYYGDTCCPTDCNTCYEYNNCCCDRFWGSAEYLYWKIQDGSQPVPLLVEGPETVPNLNDDDVTIVLGNKKTKNDWSSGGRLKLGYWFDDCKTFGAEASYFILPYNTKKRTISGFGVQGEPNLAVPFFNVFTSTEAAYPVSTSTPVPLPLAGKASLKIRNRMQGAELNGIWSIPTCNCNFKVDLLAGFRWWNFDEALTFRTDNTFVTAPIFVNGTKDKFSTQNNFYGGQIGIGLDYNCNCFFANITGKVAFGTNCSKLDVSGHYVTNGLNPGFPGIPSNGVFYEGGLFAQESNIGSTKKNYFTYIPEVTATFGYQVTECLRIKVGYNFLWINKVLRPGNLIDRNINPTQSVALTQNPDAALIGEPAPVRFTKTSSLWAQGVTAGFDFSF